MRVPYGHDGRKCPLCGELMYLGFSSYSCDCSSANLNPLKLRLSAWDQRMGVKVSATYYPLDAETRYHYTELIISWFDACTKDTRFFVMKSDDFPESEGKGFYMGLEDHHLDLINRHCLAPPPFKAVTTSSGITTWSNTDYRLFLTSKKEHSVYGT